MENQILTRSSVKFAITQTNKQTKTKCVFYKKSLIGISLCI